MKDGVITVPSEYFFFGSDEQKKGLPYPHPHYDKCLRLNSDEQKKGLPYPHSHYDKCLRLNYSGDDELVREGVEIISRRYREYS